jgi:hypothetical protein
LAKYDCTAAAQPCTAVLPVVVLVVGSWY